MTLDTALKLKQIPQFKHPVSGYLLSPESSYLCAYHAFHSSSKSKDDKRIIEAVKEALAVQLEAVA